MSTSTSFWPPTAPSLTGAWHHGDATILMRRVVQLPAPGRGAYDRALSRAERDADHRERLLLAGAEVLASGVATVTRIVAHAGVGRSTFYEFFDSPEHLLEHCRQRALRRLETVLTRALAEAHTPRSRMRALVDSWLKELAARPAEARVVLTRQSSSHAPLSPAGTLFQQALTRCSLATHGGIAPATSSTDDLALLAAAGAVEVVTRRHLSSATVEDAPRILSELISRLLG